MNPTAILTADWHLRLTIPICRKDDFLKMQEEKVNFILRQSRLHQCPVIIAGDIGNKPEWKNELLIKYIKKFKAHSQKIYVLPGQHDLPNHRLDKFNESGLGVLVESKAVIALKDSWQTVENGSIYFRNFPFSVNIVNIVPDNNRERNIAIIHQLVSRSKLWEEQKNFTSAKSLLKKFPCYDLIVSGDNHQSFIEEYKGRLLVNPGSLMRTTIAQVDYNPRIYLWYAETNTVEEVFIPIKQDVFKPIDEVIKIDKDTEIFVKALKKNYDINISFESNMKRCLNSNRAISDKVRQKIYTAMNNEE